MTTNLAALEGLKIDVSTFLRFATDLIRFYNCYKTFIISCMSFDQLGPLTMELDALGWLKNWCLTVFLVAIDLIVFIF